METAATAELSGLAAGLLASEVASAADWTLAEGLADCLAAAKR